MKREECLLMAKLAEQAKSYNEMAKYMETLVTTMTGDEEPTPEERDLFAAAYKNVSATAREALRAVTNFEVNEGERNEDLEREYRLKLEGELSRVCYWVLKILETKLIPAAKTSESKVFYMKMKGDYYRYLAEFDSGAGEKPAAHYAIISYKAAQDIAFADLSPSHPIRLGLQLNFSLFYYDIVNDVDKACSFIRQAFDEAIDEMLSSRKKCEKDITLILQHMSDNFIMWTSNKLVLDH